MSVDLSTQQQREDFPEWLMTDGGYLIFARDDRPGWTHLWPTGKKEPGEGIIRTREEAAQVVQRIVAWNAENNRPAPRVVVLRIAPEKMA